MHYRFILKDEKPCFPSSSPPPKQNFLYLDELRGMSSSVAQSLSRFNLENIYFLKELPTKLCASEKTYSSYMVTYNWKLSSKQTEFMKVKMWNISKCISCPYEITSLSFPFKSRVEQPQITSNDTEE